MKKNIEFFIFTQTTVFTLHNNITKIIKYMECVMLTMVSLNVIVTMISLNVIVTMVSLMS